MMLPLSPTATTELPLDAMAFKFWVVTLVVSLQVCESALETIFPPAPTAMNLAKANSAAYKSVVTGEVRDVHEAMSEVLNKRPPLPAAMCL